MQMKRIYGLVAGLLVLTGCSKEEQVGDAGNGDRIQFGKAMLVSEAGVSEWNGTSLGVSLLSPGGVLDPTQTGYNVELQYTDNGWVSQPALRWTDNAEGTVCDLIAYAPYTSAITDPAAVAVEPGGVPVPGAALPGLDDLPGLHVHLRLGGAGVHAAAVCGGAERRGAP